MNRVFTYTGVFLIALANLMLEILLTRIISVTAWYHLAFFVISLAMLGMTAGAVLVFIRTDLFSDEWVPTRLTQSAFGFAISIPISVAIVLSEPLMPVTDLMSFVALLWSGAVLALPFFMGGVTLTLALTRAALPPSIAYGVDLCGASAGCLLIIPILDTVDAPSAALFSAAIAAIGAASFASASGANPRLSAIAFVALSLLCLINATTHPSPLRPTWSKGRYEDVDKMIYVNWNTYSRVTVDDTTEEPPVFWSKSIHIPEELNAPLPQRRIKIDGEAATMMAEHGNWLDKHAYLAWDLTTIAHFIRSQGPVAVIGVGGGRDVLEAARVGHRPVVGIEMNSLIVDLHTKVMSEFSGLTQIPYLELVADEARSYMSRDERQYEMIIMSLIDTWASTGAGAFSLSENGLYTVEAWQTFLSHLTPRGIFTVSRWYVNESPGETSRMMTLAMETLWSMGKKDPLWHLMLLQNENIATLLVSPSPFSPADRYRIKKEAERLGYTILHMPFEPPGTPMIGELVQIKTRDEMWRWAAAQRLDVTPPTDMRPFFFNMLKVDDWLIDKSSVNSMDMVFLGNLQATQTLVYAILVSLILTLVTIIVPILIRRRDMVGVPRSEIVAASAYFSLIGLGFMYVEMGLLSRLNVIIGHPTLALAVLLGGITLFLGLGSLLSNLISLDNRWIARLYPLVPALLVLTTSIVMVEMVDESIATTIHSRIAVSLLLLAPSALGMGLCFPLGLRLVERLEKSRYNNVSDTEPNLSGKTSPMGPWLWGINGAFGVCASGLALGTSMVWGIQNTLLVGSICYFLLLLATWRMDRTM